MKTTTCNFCGSNRTIFRYQLRDWVTKTPGQFTLVECADCGLLYLNPQLDWAELGPYYQNDYLAYSKLSPSRGLSLVKRIKAVAWQRRGRAVQKRQPGGRLVDIGCATGDFLREMEQLGSWACYGVEPVAYAAETARNKTRAEIFEGDLIAAHFPDLFFDAVTLWDVLEHTDNPDLIIQETLRILRPGGLLVIRVPDPGSFMARLFGEYWIGLDAPRHLFGFPRSLLEKHLKESGFTGIEITYLSSEHFTFFASLSALLYGSGRKFFGKAAERLAYSTMARAILAPLFWSISRFRKGSSPVYFARKAGQPVSSSEKGKGNGNDV